MLAGRAEQGLIGDEALGVGAEGELVGGADGAVQLDRLLVDEAGAAADLRLGAGDGAGLGLRRTVEAERGEQARRPCLFLLDPDAHEAVLQRLKIGQRLPN
jgi:hypothetical protein